MLKKALGRLFRTNAFRLTFIKEHWGLSRFEGKLEAVN